MTLPHFHSHHPVSCKEGIIYSQALRYNIISDDHILQAELNNLTCILLAWSYPLHLIVKNIKKALTHSCNYLLSQQTPHTETNILHIITPFSDIGKQLTAIIHRNWHIVANDTTLSTIWPSKPLSAYTKSNSIQPSCTLCTNIWCLTAKLLGPLPIRIHIHQYGYTNI